MPNSTSEQLRERVGEQLRRRRQQRGVTLKDLADRAGLSTRFLGEIERGRANPSLSSLHDIAHALGTSLVGLLIGGDTAALEELSRRLPSLNETQAAAAMEAIAAVPGDRPIALLGLRGAGKSTVGERVASLTGRSFIEVDRQIEREAGMTLSSIFELHGEARYRELEHTVLEVLLSAPSEPPPVLEVSGGIVTHEPAFRLLCRRAFCVWLKASPQEHWDRVVAQGDHRPMGGRDRARLELEELYERRAPLYAQAAVTVATTGKSVAEVADELLRMAASAFVEGQRPTTP